MSQTIAKHWKFATTTEPKFNSNAVAYLSVEKTAPNCFTCFVEWSGKQKESAIRTYFGKFVSSIVSTTVYEIIDKKNERKEYGVKTKQGQSSTQAVSKAPKMTEGERDTAELKFSLKTMLVTMPFANIVRMHNFMFGPNLSVLDYALFWYRTVDQQPLQYRR
ncbi:hypothetical protein FACS189472_13060 [Alphaproteobacteria bacterium]|nr:hypothetical protein FACS189472_13060 [Alphaproteobacteria bacterium]